MLFDTHAHLDDRAFDPDRKELLSDREMTVIHHFYIERTWDYIEILNEKLGVERSQIYRIKDKAMTKLCRGYFGVR